MEEARKKIWQLQQECKEKSIKIIIEEIQKFLSPLPEVAEIKVSSKFGCMEEDGEFDFDDLEIWLKNSDRFVNVKSLDNQFLYEKFKEFGDKFNQTLNYCVPELFNLETLIIGATNYKLEPHWVYGYLEGLKEEKSE